MDVEENSGWIISAVKVEYHPTSASTTAVVLSFLLGLCAPLAPPALSREIRKVLNSQKVPLGKSELNSWQGWKWEGGTRSWLKMTSRTEGGCWAAGDLIQLGPVPIKMRSSRMGRGGEKNCYFLHFSQYCGLKHRDLFISLLGGTNLTWRAFQIVSSSPLWDFCFLPVFV